ncbi:sensor histidine kinase [Paenibacillus typhae]|uniref:histidine kinase n=1 Tax=Paenibacillus typhae TaxID=1174501 RepID=A0A1G8GHQ2_9BACL|nr:HAMP domain-containing sensor histidine kinase [Paenibacillus typhae]SDH93860.1 HAMP domain-containing protein [Paenibacillus typhae]
MRYKSGIRNKLLVSHVGVALAALLSIVLLVNLVMNFSFNLYREKQQKAEVQQIVDELVAAFDESYSGWESGVWMLVSHQAIVGGYIVRVYDKGHRLLWDTSRMGMHGQMNTDTTLPAILTNIERDNQLLGTLEYQPINESSQSLSQQFLRMFNTLLGAALVIVMIGTYLFSRYTAKSLSQPLLRIKHAATRMREGDLSARVEVTVPGTEIEEVGQALNHLAEGLEKQDNLRKVLTADVAHELRTPLTTIQSHLEAFQDGIWEPTPDKLEVCHDQVLRLVHLIHDLENLAAVENPMVQLKKEMISLSDIVRQSLNTVSGQYVHNDLEVDLINVNEVWITGDRSRLAQVFDNLLSNAFKYTPSGNIHIEITKNQLEGLVTISDTGLGIAETELPYIFERFYRGDKSRNRKTGGAGIGLAVVNAIIKAHAGTIEVHSKLDIGTTVLVRLPIIR